MEKNIYIRKNEKYFEKKKPVFQRPRDKLRDNRRRRAQEILKQQAAESAERERVALLEVHVRPLPLVGVLELAVPCHLDTTL